MSTMPPIDPADMARYNAASADYDARQAAGKTTRTRPSTPDDPGRPVDDRDTRVLERELERERIRRAVRRRLDDEERGPAPPLPAILTLRERLLLPVPVTPWRIHGWQPAESRVMLAAPFKSGKTTLVGGLIRSLVDGDHWLDVAPVAPVTGAVVLLDTEMPASLLDGWLRDQQIRRTDRVLPIPLKGCLAAFNILTDTGRAEWAARLRDRVTEYLVLDCLRPVLDTFGLDEHKDGGRFLVALDALLHEAGIPECAVVHHMGHVTPGDTSRERARGDSRFRDWPDVEWRLVRQDDDPASDRYITAFGRDVDVAECKLDYDRKTRRLRLAGGSRSD